MVFHGNKWGWRATAARLLLAPVLAAGLAAPAVAQAPVRPAQTAPAKVPPARAKMPAVTPKARTADPKELLRQGRKALAAGQFNRAQDLARQADAANPSGRWGLFSDTPESLENDVRDARAKADKAEAEKLLKQAKAMTTRAAALKAPADKMAALNQAFAMADRAVGLYGPTGFWDGLLGDDPVELRKEIDAARAKLRKTTLAPQVAKRPTPTSRTGPVAKAGKPSFTPGSTPSLTSTGKPTIAPGSTPSFASTGRPSFAPSVQPVAGTGKPADPRKLATAALTTPKKRTPAPAPMNPADKATAVRLVADGRALSKKNRLAEACAKAHEAGKLKAPFGPTEDSPDDLLRDVLADGKRQVTDLTREADTYTRSKDYKKAELALSMANQIATDLGFYTKQMEDRLAAVKKAQTGAPAAVALVDPPVITAAPLPPEPEVVAAGGPATPSTSGAEPVVPAIASGSIPTPGPIPVPVPTETASTGPAPKPVVTPEVPTAPQPRVVKPADTVASGPIIPTLPGTPAPVAPRVSAAPSIPSIPQAPAVAVKPPSAGERLLDQARNELRRGELEAARRIATQAHNGNHGGTVKDDAQALLREIDAEDTVRKKDDAAKSFAAAADHFNAKRYEQALGVFRLLNPQLLSPEQKKKLPEYVQTCTDEVAKLHAPAAPAVASREPAGPLVPTQPKPTGSGLADQVRALSDVEFQKLRSEGLEAQTKAQEAFNRGETDLAIQMLTDYGAKVQGSKLSAARQDLLLSAGVDRRLNTFRIMKRQMDFVTQEAKDKQYARERIVGRSVAEQQKKEEMAKKAREVEALAKAHKYQDAERLALQLKTLDPDNATLSALYEITKRQRRLDESQKLKDSKEHMFYEGLQEAERPGPVATMDRPLITNPEIALRAAQRGRGDDIYLRTRSAAEREIELRLDKPMTVEFQNAPLREVIDKIQKETALNISIDDAAVADKKIDLDQVLVTDTLRNLSVRNILSLVLDKARLKFAVENDVVRITTEEKAKGRLYTKVFSVMDLVTPVPDFALADHQTFGKAVARANQAPAWTQAAQNGGFTPRGGLNNGNLVSGGGPWDPKGVGGAGRGSLQTSPLNDSATLATTPRANMSEQLMKLIQGMVRPYSWDELGGPGKLFYYDIGGALVVNQTADVIREVQDLLEALRRLQETSVAVEIRVISLSEAFFERIGVDFSMNIKTKQGGRDGSSFERMLTTGMFRPEPFINDINAKGVTVGWNPAMGGFTPDLDVPIRATSYPLTLPPFGGYQGALSPTLNGGLGVGLAFLNDIQVYMFMEAAQGDRRVNVMQAPKVTLFNGQTSTVFVSDVAFFTIGLTAVQAGNGQMVFIPQNTPLPIGISPPLPGTGGGSPGVSVTVQAIVSADRRFVRMNLAPSLTSITSATVPLFPVTAFITPVFEGGSQGVPIPFTQFFQQPSVSEISVQTTVAVPDGGTVVLGGLKTLAEGRNEFGPPVLSQIPYLNRLFKNVGVGRETKHIMIMVTPRIIIQSEEELNQTGVVGGSVIPGGGVP
ncbi:MAG TPA: hypothetical protein VFG68_02760 [Fimbriiglobus sp.]|nr:hypothetical protein [Fimbriiglobus sp.]